jgi:predicted transcriptional regulator
LTAKIAKNIRKVRKEGLVSRQGGLPRYPITKVGVGLAKHIVLSLRSSRLSFANFAVKSF